jgi:hypothetical protein
LQKIEQVVIADGNCRHFSQSSFDLIKEMISKAMVFFPLAYLDAWSTVQ